MGFHFSSLKISNKFNEIFSVNIVSDRRINGGNLSILTFSFQEFRTYILCKSKIKIETTYVLLRNVVSAVGIFLFVLWNFSIFVIVYYNRMYLAFFSFTWIKLSCQKYSTPIRWMVRKNVDVIQRNCFSWNSIPNFRLISAISTVCPWT